MHCPSSHCHLSINQVPLQSHLYFSMIWPGQAAIMKNCYGQIIKLNKFTGQYYVSWAQPFPLIAIYLYTKFHLNANNSFKVICWTRFRTEGLYASPFEEHENVLMCIEFSLQMTKIEIPLTIYQCFLCDFSDHKTKQNIKTMLCS